MEEDKKIIVRLRRQDLEDLMNKGNTILATNNADLGVGLYMSEEEDKVILVLDATWTGEVMQIEVPKEMIEFEELGD